MQFIQVEQTAAVAEWLEHQPREWESWVQSRDRPKSLELVVVAFPLGTQDYGNSTMTGLSVSG